MRLDLPGHFRKPQEGIGRRRDRTGPTKNPLSWRPLAMYWSRNNGVAQELKQLQDVIKQP